MFEIQPRVWPLSRQSTLFTAVWLSFDGWKVWKQLYDVNLLLLNMTFIIIFGIGIRLAGQGTTPWVQRLFIGQYDTYILSSKKTSSFEQRCVQRKGLRLNCWERFVRFCQICQICRFRFVRFVRFAGLLELLDLPDLSDLSISEFPKNAQPTTLFYFFFE